MISDSLSLADTIFSNKDNLLSFTILALAVLAAYLIISPYKDKVSEYIKCRRNIPWFSYLLISLIAILSFSHFGLINIVWLIVLLVAWLAYSISCFLSLKPKEFSNYSNLRLRKYEKYLINGSAYEHMQYFRKGKRWYLFTVEDQLEYHMIASQFFADVHEYDKAYEELLKIKDSWIYQCEIDLFNLQKALMLVQMGNMKAGYQLLGDTDKNESINPMVWFTYSFIYENAGDIDKALEYSTKAVNLMEGGYKASKAFEAQAYNNYAHLAIVKGNRQEALRYLDHAWNVVRDSKDLRILNIVAANRIAQMSILGKSKEDCEKFLAEYKSMIQFESYANLIEYNNCAITYYRQNKNAHKEFELIKSGFKDVINQLNYEQAQVYTACTFRMLMNGHFEHDWFDKYIKPSNSKFMELPLMIRLGVFKEYIGFYQQQEFRSVFDRRPYAGLKNKILRYYRESAIADIDNELVKCMPYNTYKYLSLMCHKLSILKIIQGENHIDNSKDIYVSLSNELYDWGLHIDSVNILMTLVDECTSPYNLLLYKPFWRNAVRFSDYISGAPLAPSPILDEDGIHIHYFHLEIGGPYAIKAVHIDVIKEHIDTIISEFHSWKSHPYKVDLSIEIARILMCLDRKDEAKEFFDYFKNSNISEMHMASWFRDDVSMLEKELMGV